ncbi:Signal transduction histidine kinase [Reichenbachiella faecimaris]|uniref:histidine kinase n=1 Tax=Reichenbachiella faecimaris TaxID=692418 RepID=A0A1W2G738_REIFA|nr:ATP-binding protein [Reichenbachiella faecimaris]SMD32489.1 Signal transduction histidine kinase [Reichenbachiella faecimaris]
MSLIKSALLCLAFLPTVIFNIWAQSSEKGLPFIDYYAPSDYRAGSFNFNVIRDSLGIYYFSNDDGVLVYNGVDWNLIKVTKEKSVYWVQQDNQGTIYVGSDGEFGYLKSSDSGKLAYVSLMDHIDPQFHDFGAVWEIACSSKEVVFRSRKYIFKWKDNKIKVFHPSDQGFDIAFTVRDTVFTRNRGVGLMYMDGDHLKMKKGGEYFADIKVNIFLPYEDALLIGSRYDGLFLMKDGEVQVLETEADDFFKKYKIYHGCVTHDGNYAFAAYTKGVAIIDKNGKLLEMLDEKSGLIDFQYLFVGMFDANNLWIANGVGTSKVKILSPLSYFDQRRGLIDVGTDIIRYQGNVYATTLRGLFKLERGDFGGQFVPFNSEDFYEIYSLGIMDDQMIVGCQRGLIAYSNDKFSFLDDQRLHYARVSQDETKVYVGIGEVGMGMYHEEANSLKLIKLEGFTEPIKKIEELGDLIVFVSKYGTLGIVSHRMTQGMQYLKLEEEYQVGNAAIVPCGDKVLVVARDAWYYIDKTGKLSEPRPLALSNVPAKILQVVSAKEETLWVSYQDEQRVNYNELVVMEEGQMTATGIAFGSHFHVTSSFSDLDSVLWFIGDGGAVRYDQKIPTIAETGDFRCHVGKMVWGKDSVIFENGSDVDPVVLPYDQTDIRFTFFTNEVNASEEKVFQYRLVGRDNEWSDWSRESKKDYTGLAAGEYIFHVRAKNTINQLSKVDAYHFYVSRPWYRSRYAIIAYVASILVLIYILFRIRTASLEQAKLNLERIVSKRTAEVEAQKKDLETQRLVLQNANDTKNQLFSIIGHDLRSPLNSLQGLTDLIHHYQAEQQTEMVDEMVEHMADSVKRLRHLLDNLLTWALNQSGNFKVDPELIKVDFFLKEIISILRESAKSKKITLELSGSSGCLIHADRNSLSTVLRNLINNAIKFSNEGSKIEVGYGCDHQKTTITISDNGVGISDDKLEEIFELTHSTYGTNNEKGTGLGLVLVSEFVALNDGTIEVSSKLGEGTTFTLTFPNK